MVDLHLFLGRPLKLAGKDSQAQDDGLIGAVPQLLVDEEQNFLKRAHDQSHDLVSQINNDDSTNVLFKRCCHIASVLSRYSALIHWLVRGQMTSSNEAVYPRCHEQATVRKL